MRRRGRSGEAGFVATELVLGIGVLLVPVALLVLTLPAWSERQTTARAIARETARTIAVGGWCEPARAQDLAEDMAANLGVDGGDVSVELACLPGRLPRGGELEVRVTVVLPAVAIPGVAEVAAWHWTAVHRHPIDPYRSFA